MTILLFVYGISPIVLVFQNIKTMRIEKRFQERLKKMKQSDGQ